MERHLTLIIFILLATAGLSACKSERYNFFDPVEAGVNTGGIGGTSKTFSCDNIIIGEDFETDMVCAHNALRQNLPYGQPTPDPPLDDLKWSAELAKFAQSHADKCRFEHSYLDTRPFSTVNEEIRRAGENIYAWPSGQLGDYDVISQWANGAANYTFSVNFCQGSDSVCEPYKQMVWADTYEVGCGKATCAPLVNMTDGMAYDFWVCEYRHRGNIDGEWPYETQQ